MRPHPVFVRAFEYPQGYPGYPHRHRLAQVVYPIRGAVSVESGSGHMGRGVVHGSRDPALAGHRVSAHGNASLRSVFVDTDVYPGPRHRPGRGARQRVAARAHPRGRPSLHGLRRRGPGRGRCRRADRAVAARRCRPRTRPCGCPASRIRCCSRSPPRSIAIPRTRRASTSGRAGSASARATSPRLFKQDTGVTFSTWRALHQVKRSAGAARRGSAGDTRRDGSRLQLDERLHRDVQAAHRPHARRVADHDAGGARGLLDQGIAGEAEDALADLVAGDLGRPARDRHRPAEDQHLRDDARRCLRARRRRARRSATRGQPSAACARR